MFDFFLQLSIKSKIQENKREHSFVNYNNIKNILILFNIDQWNEIQPIISILQQDGKQVMAWTVYSKGGHETQYPSFVKVIQPKEINWLNLFKLEVTDQFARLQYDTLLDLNYANNYHLLSLLSQNKSKFCIGFMEREYRSYDFIFLREHDQSISKSCEELKKFLENI